MIASLNVNTKGFPPNVPSQYLYAQANLLQDSEGEDESTGMPETCPTPEKGPDMADEQHVRMYNDEQIYLKSLKYSLDMSESALLKAMHPSLNLSPSQYYCPSELDQGSGSNGSRMRF